MKWLLLFLLIPYFSFSQTVHLKDGRIFYKNEIKTADRSSENIAGAIQKALSKTKNKNINITTASPQGEIIATADMKLISDQTTINTLRYEMKIIPNGKGFEYTIDSVSLIQKERGVGTKTISSGELVSNMEITGPTAGKTEKQLNEIDMRFQQLMDLLELYVKDEAQGK
jgi:hypothetical protein